MNPLWSILCFIIGVVVGMIAGRFLEPRTRRRAIPRGTKGQGKPGRPKKPLPAPGVRLPMPGIEPWTDEGQGSGRP